jgi:hypothetical protein
VPGIALTRSPGHRQRQPPSTGDGSARLRVGGPVERFGEPAARAQATGATICITAVDRDPAANATRTLLAQCADVLNAAGARMAIEFLPYTPLATLAQARDQCAAIGWRQCGLLIDA